MYQALVESIDKLIKMKHYKEYDNIKHFERYFSTVEVVEFYRGSTSAHKRIIIVELDKIKTYIEHVDFNKLTSA